MISIKLSGTMNELSDMILNVLAKDGKSAGTMGESDLIRNSVKQDL